MNICGGNIPKPPPGRCWGAVICDPTVKIVVWYKPIFLRDGVVKVLSDGEITFGTTSGGLHNPYLNLKKQEN